MNLATFINYLRNSRIEVELYNQFIFNHPLEILDTKMTMKLRSLKPLRRVENMLMHGEAYYMTRTNHVLRLFIGRYVHLNICRGKSKKVQVQGLADEEDLQPLLARMRTLDLMMDGILKLNKLICESEVHDLEALAVPLEPFQVRNNSYKVADAKIVIKDGRAIFIGRCWDDIELCIDVLAQFVVA